MIDLVSTFVFLNQKHNAVYYSYHVTTALMLLHVPKSLYHIKRKEKIMCSLLKSLIHRHTKTEHLVLVNAHKMHLLYQYSEINIQQCQSLSGWSLQKKRLIIRKAFCNIIFLKSIYQFSKDNTKLKTKSTKLIYTVVFSVSRYTAQPR